MEENVQIQRGAAPTQPQQTTTATFEFPTQVISLPSEGKVYSESNPLSKGTLEIKYLTAKEEDILADTNLINKGLVLDKLLESIIVQQGVNSDDLIVGDKNAVYLAARVLGYGPEYDVEITDPFSGERQKVTIDLTTVQTKDVDYSLLSPNNRYDFTLPSDTKLTFKFLTHKDEKDINNDIKAMERLSKGKVNSSEVTTRLKYMIVAVNGNSDRSFVNNWVINQFIAKDVKAFRAYVRSISPDLDMKFSFTSEITGETEALDIPFGIDFFYPTA
jgi:hypothetical protein